MTRITSVPSDTVAAAEPFSERKRRARRRWLVAAVLVGAMALWLAKDYFMPTINVGDQAPQFELTSHSGKSLKLADYLGKQVVVLYFYPRDNTPGCTTQACSFRDAYEDFVKAGAVVIGVSSDSVESHQEFAATKRLPFELVSDPDNRLRKLFGVPKTLGLLPGRVTYVIDREGVVRLVFNSQLNAGTHVTEAFKVVQQLSS